MPRSYSFLVSQPFHSIKQVRYGEKLLSFIAYKARRVSAESDRWSKAALIFDCLHKITYWNYAKCKSLISVCVWNSNDDIFAKVRYLKTLRALVSQMYQTQYRSLIGRGKQSQATIFIWPDLCAAMFSIKRSTSSLTLRQQRGSV